jgi:serine/threonine protein kinase
LRNLNSNLDKLNKYYIGLEYVSEEELSDILREIELMKDLGKHENVIQMFGCCIRCRPICLILEYAPGGNLKNYLRSLKKKVITPNLPFLCVTIFKVVSKNFPLHLRV